MKYLNKCAFWTDAENQISQKECKCPKIEMRLWHQGIYEEVSVCRNYYAELFQRYYRESNSYSYEASAFESACKAKMEIVQDLFGSHLHKWFNLPPSGYYYQKERTKDFIHAIGNSYAYGGGHYHYKGCVYKPFFYISLDDKSVVRYDMKDVFRFICENGIDSAKNTFGYDSSEFIHEVVKSSIQTIVDCLESRKIKYKVTKVKPILNLLKLGNVDTDVYELKMINALTEILDKISENELTY